MWKDRKQVNILSSNGNFDVTAAGKPSIVELYNINMGGVDLNDQLCSYYRTGRASHKWWRYVLWYLLNISLTNAWILWKNSVHVPTPTRSFDHMKFRLQVAGSLRGGFTSRRYAKGRGAAADVARPVAMTQGHALIKIRGRTRVCSLCSRMGRTTPGGRKKETAYMFQACNVPLCRLNDCFRRFHNLNAEQ